MRTLLSSALSLLVLLPSTAAAQLPKGQTGDISDKIFDTPNLGAMTDPKQPGYGFCLLGFFCDLSFQPGSNFVYTIIRYAASFIGLVMVIIILYGAARIFTSLGRDEGVAKGKNAIVAGIIGFIVTLFAYGMVAAFTRITR